MSNAPVDFPAATAHRVNVRPIDDAVLNVADFNERIVGAYNDGSAEMSLPADRSTARSPSFNKISPHLRKRPPRACGVRSSDEAAPPPRGPP